MAIHGLSPGSIQQIVEHKRCMLEMDTWVGEIDWGALPFWVSIEAPKDGETFQKGQVSTLERLGAALWARTLERQGEGGTRLQRSSCPKW